MKDNKINKDEEIKILKEKIKELEKSEIKRKQAETQMQHLNLILRSIRNLNQLIIREKNMNVLIQKVCEILTKNNGYYNAWIVLLDEKGKHLASAEAGLGKVFTPMKKLLKQEKWTKCGKRALNQKKLIITEDPEKECTDCPLSQSYAGRGAYIACFIHHDRIYGLLSVSIPKSFIKDNQEQKLFREIVADIGFALHNIMLEKTLGESENNFRDLVENMSDGVAIADENAYHIYVNSRFSEITGFSRDELLNMSGWDFTRPEDLTRLKKRMKERIAGKPVQAFYDRIIIKKDGTEVPVEMSTTVTTWQEKKRAMAVVHDITGRKKAEETIKESEKKYRTLVESMEEGIVSVDENDNFTFVNQIACNIFGYSKKEQLQMNFKDLVAPESNQIYLKQISIRKTEKSSKYELNIIKKNGDIRTISTHVTPIIKNQEYYGAFGIFQDITDKKKAEEELKKYRDDLEELVKKRTLTLEKTTKEIKESQQALSLLLEDVNDSRDELQAKTNELNRSLKNIEDEKGKIDAILKSIGDGLIVTDLDNKIILMNQVAEDLLNIRLSEVLNKPLNFIFDKKLQEKFNFNIPEVEKGYQFDFEIVSKKSKTPYIYNATALPIKDKKDKITGIITNFHDVTQEHKIDQMKTNFISTAAHELRTPLTAIQGYSEILNIRDDLDDADKKKFLNHINRQSINLGNIINDMLDISRIESGRGFTLKLEKSKINEEILRTCSAYEISYPNYLFYAYLPDKELEVFIDRGKIEQVMENILSNAVKYSTQGSKIRIKSKIAGNKYIVTVEDEGIGMSPKELSRVFEKFFRGDYSNTSIEGTGLGMSIVKHIIEAHKGKVWLESKLGQGTKAHFSIPIPLKKIN